MTTQEMIDLARTIATKAHAGQTRQGGEPYITHPEAVANAVEDRLKPIAWLHDVVEDTAVTLNDLKDAGFDTYVLTAIDLLTHKNHEPNIDYWRRIIGNRDASIVKVADIKHNLSGNPNEYQKKKYAKALELFGAAGYLS